MKHSDKLDLISRFEGNKTFTIVLVVISITLLMGLNFTGYMAKNQNPKEITIFAEKWEFIPNTVKVKYNEDVRLKLVTSDKNESFGFKLSRYMYNQKFLIEPNKTKTFDFTAYEKGTFTYRCENPCGWGKNLMIGKLIVE